MIAYYPPIPAKRILPWNSRFSLSGASALFTIFAAVVIYLVSALCIPRLIEAAYRGEAWPCFNALIHARGSVPVQIYLDQWTAMRSLLLTSTLAAGGLFTLAASPRFQAAIDRWLGPPRRDSARLRTPVGIPVLLGFLLIAAQVAEIYLDRDHWPFLVYSMYAAPGRAEISWNRVYGIARDGREFQLYASTYTPPFTDVGIAYALDSLLERRDSTGLAAALAGCHRLYLDARKLGRHHGPDLQALRIYRLTWRIEEGLRNREIPDSKQKLYEFRLPL